MNDVVQDVDGQDKQTRQVVEQLCIQSLVLGFHPP